MIKNKNQQQNDKNIKTMRSSFFKTAKLGSQMVIVITILAVEKNNNWTMSMKNCWTRCPSFSVCLATSGNFLLGDDDEDGTKITDKGTV